MQLPSGHRIAAVASALIALSGAPAGATFNWDDQCTAKDDQAEIELTIVFVAGTFGRIDVADFSATATTKDPPATLAFEKNDVEQFWTRNDEFRLSLAGEEPDAQLLIATTCQAGSCSGTYKLTWGGKTLEGSVSCRQSEAG